VLELDRLTRVFGSLRALDELSFSVQPGQMFGFVGGNGAGKTTAMRIVMGIDQPDAGDVRWQGRRLDGRTRSTFGYMPEERGLYAKTPSARQLAYFARLHGLSRADAGEQARYWLDRFDLGDRMSEPAEQLSLGNQQRVQLAAALVHRPTLLVLDEPFSGLDPTGVDALSEVLLEQSRRGVAVLFSSHQLELVERLCHSVAIIDRGRLVAGGTVEELRRRGPRPSLRVVVDGAADARWARGLAGVHVVRDDGATVLLDLAEGVDDQVVLGAARAAGPVRHFAVVQPTLSELYREAVRERSAADGSAATRERAS
jgi:ABC-2 type transport system ATP-binding protein